MESINISFSANRQTLTGGGLYCASNTVHYIIADFELGDGWDGFDSVRAVWSNDFKCISTVLDPDGSCTVPHEVLERRGKVSVNLVGSILEDDELTDRLTTYPVLAITVDANAKICGTETAEVTPSQFEQFVQIVKDEVAKVKDIDRAELNEDYTLTFYFSDGTETTVGPIRGEQGETGNGIASAVLNDDYTLTLTFTDGTEYTTPSIRGEQGEQGEPGEVTLAQLSSVLPTDTASGAIASFPDGSDLFDYLSCIVNIEPVQDLHGYDKPWVGGAGANKWDEVWELGGYSTVNGEKTTQTNTIRSTNAIQVTPNGSYYIGVFGTGAIYLFYYDQNGDYVGNSGGYVSSGAKTLPNDAYQLRFQLNPAYGTTYNHDIAINYPSTVTTYSPWENLCPITGWTGCEVDVAGVNLIDEATATIYRRYFQDLGDKHVWTSDAGSGSFALLCKPNTTYTVSCDNSSIALFRVGYINVDPDALASSDRPTLYGVIKETASGSTTITTGADAKAVVVQVNNAIATARTAKLQIEYDSTASDYHAYNGTTYPVSWQTEAGTVYGGTVDLVTGVLTVTMVSVDLGTLTYTYDTSLPYPFMRSGGIKNYVKKPSVASELANIMCSALEPQTSYSIGSLNAKGIGIHIVGEVRIAFDGMSTDTTAFKASMDGVYLVYELATPTTYQLDPVQVACLLGQNNVWADCGSIEEVKYKAYVQKWVEKKMGE